MTRRERRRNRALQRSGLREAQSQRSAQTASLPVSLRCCDRKSLLLGTALVSTLLLGTVAAPTPAQAVFTCATFVGTGPAPINPLPQADSIICVNTEARTSAGGNAIELSTSGDDHDIYLNNSGKLTAYVGTSARQLHARRVGAGLGRLARP